VCGGGWREGEESPPARPVPSFASASLEPMLITGSNARVVIGQVCEDTKINRSRARQSEHWNNRARLQLHICMRADVVSNCKKSTGTCIESSYAS
jgi:hypothetical protein